MVREIVIRNGNSRRPHYGINQSISTVRQRIMIDPNMARSKNGDPITIRHRSPTIMRLRAPNHGVTSSLTIMNVNPMHDDVRHVLNRDTRSAGDVHVHATTVDRFEAVHDEFLV